MTEPAAPPSFARLRRIGPAAGGLLLLAIAAWFVATFGSRMLSLAWTPHAPDIGLVLRQPVEIRIHIAGALTALVIGTVLLVGVKGTTLHRTLGWTWVIAMAVTAVSSLFIRQINEGGFSLIHLLSGWTVVSLPMAVHAARRHRVAIHRRAMTGLFVGGLLIAGALAFLPGRLMWTVVFG